MSTNTNASNGASQRMDVEEVDNKVIEERIAEYTGNENTIFAFDFVMCEVGKEAVVQAGNPAGSNITVTAKGKQTAEEIEKRNYVTVPTRNEPVVGKDAKKEALAKKAAAAKNAETAKKSETNKDIR